MPDERSPKREAVTRGSIAKRPKKLAQVAGTHTDRRGQREPGRRLIQVMGRKLVRRLAIGSVLGATSLCLIVFVFPNLIANQAARGVFCLLTAFFFSVIVFTLYPSDYKLKISEKIGIPILLVGPAALWIGLFVGFLKLLPSEAIRGTMFLPPPGKNQLTFSSSWELDWKPVKPVYYKVKISDDQDSNQPDLLTGFYVTFDQTHDKYTAIIGIGPSNQEIMERYEVVFVRGNSMYQVNLVPDGGDYR